MAQASVITKELRNLLGVEFGPHVYEIEKGMVKKFAEAIGDANPLWRDETHARKTKYGTIIAPPTFLTSLRLEELGSRLREVNCPLTRVLNGGSELEYFQPVKVGDVISVTGKLVDIKEREGKTGKMVFLISELIYRNKKGEIIAKGWNTLIRY